MSEKSISANTLTYNKSIVGYRLVITHSKGKVEYYDLNVDAAERYGLANGMYGIEVPLINYEGLLLTKREKEEGITIKDISKNTVFLKELSALKNKKQPNSPKLKSKSIEDKKRALQMDRFNRLLKVCLNVITSTPYVKKIGTNQCIVLSLSKEIDKVLVSQGVFTTNKNLSNSLKKNLIDILKKQGYTHTSISEYKTKGKEIKLIESIISKHETEDVFCKKI